MTRVLTPSELVAILEVQAAMRTPTTEATMRQARITKAQLSRVRCGKGNGGNTSLVAIQGGTAAECQGCGTIYTAGQIVEAKPGVPGEGGVILR